MTQSSKLSLLPVDSRNVVQHAFGIEVTEDATPNLLCYMYRLLCRIS
jgi:hypothetical protein